MIDYSTLKALAEEVLANRKAFDWDNGTTEADLAYHISASPDVVLALIARVAELEKDAAMLDWLNENIFNRENLTLSGRLHPTLNMWVMFAPKGVQGASRTIIAAAMGAQA